ncbi:Anthranilate synthase, aminase component [hydrothermal vent metagenome]|uniref:Anthranilate synthase component 1 n=1 Tax=hydrothermal vent metagenome TaxID=652676 RepID=A0A3B0WCW2_9ZZZZ
MLTQQQFNQFAATGFNRIPMYRCVSADLDTPLSAWLKLANGRNTFLLESVVGGSRWGRYSIIGLSADINYVARGNQITKYVLGEVAKSYTCENVLDELRVIKGEYKVPEIAELPAFNGGLVGYLGYEIIEHIEDKLKGKAPKDELHIPDVNLMVAEEVAVFDNLAGKVWIITHVNPQDDMAFAKGQKRLAELTHKLRSGSTGYAEIINQNIIKKSDVTMSFTQAEFEHAVAKCKDLITTGDIMQIVLSQRMSTKFNARPLDVYRALRASNPSPYMYFMDFADYQVVGSSPEVLVRKEGNKVTLRPLAGTRPRGSTELEDAQLAQELLNDPKELAEHLMLIDLGRNDIGRVAEIGSVELVEKMQIEKYSHVMHIVSEVQGKIQAGKDNIDVIKAVFPAGTLSGAAKVRAMEVIAELEPVKRNVYAGAVGYWGWHDDMDWAIAIRTAVIKDKILHIQAGAGIVADSDATQEWQETLNKGKAVFNAVSTANKGEL